MFASLLICKCESDFLVVRHKDTPSRLCVHCRLLEVLIVRTRQTSEEVFEVPEMVTPADSFTINLPSLKFFPFLINRSASTR